MNIGRIGDVQQSHQHIEPPAGDVLNEMKAAVLGALGEVVEAVTSSTQEPKQSTCDLALLAGLEEDLSDSGMEIVDVEGVEVETPIEKLEEEIEKQIEEEMLEGEPLHMKPQSKDTERAKRDRKGEEKVEKETDRNSALLDKIEKKETQEEMIQEKRQIEKEKEKDQAVFDKRDAMHSKGQYKKDSS